MTLMTDTAPYLDLHVPPDEMVKYIQDLMTLPHGEIAASSALTLAQRHWGGDTPLARAALLRWGALNLAFQDKRLETWTVTRERDRIQVPAALVAAAGVAPLVIDNERAVFDIPALLDATLEFNRPRVRLSPMATAVQPAPRFGVLRTIALYKLLKVLLLLALAYGELRLSDASFTADLLSWASERPFGLEHHVVHPAVGVVQRLERIAGACIADGHPGLCGRVCGGGRRPVDAEALGRVADDGHYSLPDSVGSVGAVPQAEPGQGGGVGGQCRHRGISDLARPIEGGGRRR